MRFLSVSVVLLALAWSRALSVQGAPAVDQESPLARRSGDYQGLETRRDVSLERRDAPPGVLDALISAVTGLLDGLLPDDSEKPTVLKELQALKSLPSVPGALAGRAIPPSVSSSTLSTTSNRTVTKSRTLGALAVQTTTGTISSTSSKYSSTSRASSAPVTRRQLPPSLPLPSSLSLPVSLPVPPPVVKSGSSTNVASSTASHLTSTTSTTKASPGPV
ncbi:hypothetical protein BDN67DRAFT_1006507 [Paxillus ammoniavirescens]|nr:hypothetical protein BDN67DRAFT_1006507 [Paxillus ammoniavirescens]